MANPFGGHPTFGEYKAWAQKEGFKIDCGIGHGPDGSPKEFVVITTPEGKHLTVVDILDGDYLLPTDIDRFDRRLHKNSPWVSWSGDTGETYEGEPN